MESSINNNMSLNYKNSSIPSLADIENRFYDINLSLKVNIDYNGYLPEIGGYAPFCGIVKIKKIIIILNKDINVQIERDEDLIKLRNSIIFYNEYFVNDKELNVENLKPAPTAFSRIESQFIRRIGEIKKEDEIKNPFKNDLIKYFDNGGDSISDDEIDKYIKRKKREESSIKSSKNIKGLNTHKKQEEVIPLHSTFCKNIPRTVDFDNLEFCFENVEYIG